MKDLWKLSRAYFALRPSPNSIHATVTSFARHGQVSRCPSCGASHAPAVPISFASRSFKSFLPASTSSQFVALRRSFHSAQPNLTSAKTKTDSAEADPEKQLEKVAVDAVETDVGSRLNSEEAIEEEERTTTTSKSPPEGEIGFVDGTIDEIRILDVGDRQSRDDDSSKTPTKKEKKKKKSSDLIAMEKFDIIVPNEKGELAVEEASMRSFQLADDDRSILAPPDEAPELRKRPRLAQSDVIDPKRKGFKLGDRAKPPKLDFSLRHALFDEAEQLEGGKTKRAFEMAIMMFNKVDPKYKRGHVEMIYQATNLMKEYGLEKDLDAYKMIFDLFPKGILIPKGVIQAGFFHYPRQQDCAVLVLRQMEFEKVLPDQEFGQQLLHIFGRRSQPYWKYRRIMYWMPKLRHASPFPLIPANIAKEDGLSAGKRVLERICVDLENEITVFRVQRPEDENSDPMDSASLPWVASAMSPKQHELVAQLPVDRPIYVKGPFSVFLSGRQMEHFTLWAELPDHLKAHYAEEEELFEDYMRQAKDIDELLDSDVTRQAFRGKNRKNVLARRPSLHEQEDGIILALSVLETFSKELLTAWVKNLEASNPHLSQVPVIFSLSSAPATGLVVQQAETDSAMTIN